MTVQEILTRDKISLEKISAPAPAREYPRQPSTTQPLRVWPCPTGTSALGSHKSELADLARPIDRALKRPRRLKQRPHLAQVVFDDRLAAVEAQLADPLPGQPRIALQQPVDLLLKRVQLRAARRALVVRRPVAIDHVADRVAMQPGTPV